MVGPKCLVRGLNSFYLTRPPTSPKLWGSHGPSAPEGAHSCAGSPGPSPELHRLHAAAGLRGGPISPCNRPTARPYDAPSPPPPPGRCPPSEPPRRPANQNNDRLPVHLYPRLTCRVQEAPCHGPSPGQGTGPTLRASMAARCASRRTFFLIFSKNLTSASTRTPSSSGLTYAR